MNQLCCPICLGPLGYERSDDWLFINKITNHGDNNVEIREVHNKSNGYDLVFCWDHKYTHKIPDDLRHKVLKLIDN